MAKDIQLEKRELIEAFENGITVKDLIKKLERLDPDLVVINDCRGKMPVTGVEETEVDYCYDEIIRKRAVSIF